MDRSLTLPPSNRSKVRFSTEFGQRSLLTVDTEEEFDWSAPFSRNKYGLDHVVRLQNFQEFCEGLQVVPVYLLDWPIATSQAAIDVLSDPVATGRAEIGIQLHPWVNPPIEEEITEFNSFAGNLPANLEQAKFERLYEAICKGFHTKPLIYRAGRYGVGPNTASVLKAYNIQIDTSVRPHFNYSSWGGQNYQKFPLAPYWTDETRQLLELPLTTVYWGTLREWGSALYASAGRIPHLVGLLARMRLLERIPLTPEGISVEEAKRGIDIAIDDQLPVLVLSFHSPSLAPGNTPYVQTEEDLDQFYEWWRRIYAYLERRGIRPTTVQEIIESSKSSES